LEEKELLDKSKAGNKSALNILLELNYKVIFGFVIKMTVNETLAQDIVQDTLLKAVLNINKFNGSCKFSTWLIQISINIYKDCVKDNAQLEFKEDIILNKSFDSNGEQVIINLQFKEAITELRSLPYKQRTAFILKHYYGYSLKEISQIMSCPKGTVKSRISICITSLKKALEG
jgi:RNA polymerase sigma-70 factor, ECF subfamily